MTVPRTALYQNSFQIRAASDLAHAEQFESKRAAGCLILARNTKRILLGQRGIMGDYPMTWGTIGGNLEPTEGPRRATRREVKEETQYEGPMRLVRLMLYQAPGFEYHNFLGVVPWEFDPIKCEENNAFKWHDYNKWSVPMHPGFEKLLANNISTTCIHRHVYDLDREPGSIEDQIEYREDDGDA